MRFLLQHHPARAELLERYTGFEVVVDPEPDGPPSPWRTYRECLVSLGEDAGVIVQDDVHLCVRFHELARLQAAQHQREILCLFVSRQLKRGAGIMHDAVRMGQRSARLSPVDIYVPVVAVAWPAGVAARVLAWSDRQRWGRVRADDAVVRAAATALGIEVWASIPSLVEHADDTPSLMGTEGGRARRALLPHPSLAHLNQAIGVPVRKPARVARLRPGLR